MECSKCDGSGYLPCGCFIMDGAHACPECLNGRKAIYREMFWIQDHPTDISCYTHSISLDGSNYKRIYDDR